MRGSGGSGSRQCAVGLALALALAACRSTGPTATPLEAGTAAAEAPTQRGADAAPSAAPDPAEEAAPEASVAADARAAQPPPPGMLPVPGGTFTMGADQGGEGDERPAHPVTLAPFYLDRTEVTQAAYDECVREGACKAASPAALDTFQGLFRGPEKPIVGVSWFDARAYCAWRGKRLPREAEFERAIRGDDGRRFPWGDDPPTKQRAVYETNAPSEVGSRPAGRGPYGHDDLAGNVWEWMEDDYDPLAYVRPTAKGGIPATCDEILRTQDALRKEGKQGFTGSNPIPTECEKAIRGGAYNYPGAGLRSTNRVHHPGRFRLKMTGFRCAMDAGAAAGHGHAAPP
jgi:formylglycine-generating enzyme required for sulfatase activity